MGEVRAVSCNGVYSFSKPNRDEIVLVPGLGVEGDVHAGVTVRHRSRVRADPSQPNLRQVHLIQSELFGEVAGSGHAVAPGQLGENVTTGGLDLLRLPRGTVLRFGSTPRSSEADRGRSRPAAGGAACGGGAADGQSGGDAADGVAVADGVAGVRVVVAAARAVELERRTAAAVAALVAAVERETAGPAGGAGDPRPAVVVTGLRNPCGQIDAFRDGLLKEVAYRDAGGAFVRKAGVMGVVLRGGPVRPGDAITVELPPLPHEALDRV
jgi:MOSC domain-containing protein YiiM